MIDDRDGQFDLIPVTEGVHSDLGWYEAVCIRCDGRSGNNAEPFTEDWMEAHTCAVTDMVNHPPHYEPLPGIDFECIVLSRRLTFDVGNAVKYMWRTDRKNGRQDVEKARWYILDAISPKDPIWNDGRLSQREETKRLLRIVAEAQRDSSRSWFFYALWRENLNEALEALDDTLNTWPT